ncbi:MAG: DUF2939 domain-containing protein [Moraxellaceae bacterium]|nr:MAG: DUF2939 domain-containing protein [Moraxellaceae bacterium]
MDMKKQGAAVLVFLAFIVWQIVSPYYTVYQIKQAVEQKSSDKLAPYIDFTLLKRNLKAQLQDKLEQKISLPQNGSFFGSLTYNVASQAIDSMLNRSVTPTSIITLVSNIRSFEHDLQQIEGLTNVQGEPSDNITNYQNDTDYQSTTDYQKVQTGSSHAATSQTLAAYPVNALQPMYTSHSHAQWQYHFDGVNQFSIVQQHSESQSVRYVLTRSGLGWKLSNIILP